jgi:2-polyprenyl-3-methyl-5-hydroxy-6-metoxy-1,4-benzoquinol methylase
MSNERKTAQTMADEYNAKDFENYFKVKRHEMLRYIPRDASTVLDVGCAGGSFGELLKRERTVEVWGIEPNEDASKAASQRLDKVICDVFSNRLELPEKYFDCIVFNDVLEHLVDPYSVLEECKYLLKDKGCIVASIPNVRYFDNIWNLLVDKNWEYSDWGILDKTHLRFFTLRSITSTFENLDFHVESIEGINPLEKIHPYRVRKFKFINWLLRNKIEDMRYLQFAVVARFKVSQ